jgi:hypothetical protein
MVQKLLSIYLNSEGVRIKGSRSPDQSHGVVQEHIENYLQKGWTIVSVTVGAGASGDVSNRASGWAFVVLEK